ncbi:hypothetical protein C8J56DRAFT_1050255 [Mycena floridula]|nr:hypothetical protein C8J56DRAFT_1050255 [Mycena floridula]
MGKQSKGSGPQLNDFDWTINNNAAIGLLLAEMRKTTNSKVIMGTKKGKVYGRIGKEIWPAEYAINASTTAHRIKSKAEELIKRYKKEAKPLQQTGGGISAQTFQARTVSFGLSNSLLYKSLIYLITITVILALVG